MTWKEVKLATLQKMFSAEGLTINEADDSVSEYINAMPQAANEGLQLLCTAGKYLRRCLELEPGAAGETRTVDLKTAAPDLYRIEQLEVYPSRGAQCGQVWSLAGFLIRGYLQCPQSTSWYPLPHFR